jgi:uncharacterized membrane protein YhaH (DUF805 family)
VGLGGAVKSFFRKYVDFSGRARRSEYWWVVVFLAAVGLVALIVDTTVFGASLDAGVDTGSGQVSFSFDGAPVTAVVALGSLLPSLALFVRRLHDVGQSGWLALLLLIIVVGLVFALVTALRDSQRGDNRFGPSPKYPEVAQESTP